MWVLLKVTPAFMGRQNNLPPLEMLRTDGKAEYGYANRSPIVLGGKSFVQPFHSEIPLSNCMIKQPSEACIRTEQAYTLITWDAVMKLFPHVNSKKGKGAFDHSSSSKMIMCLG